MMAALPKSHLRKRYGGRWYRNMLCINEKSISAEREEWVVGGLSINMDINEPLTTLRALIEEKIGYRLHDFIMTLQDRQYLNESRSLVDLCLEVEGVVQINCNLKMSTLTGKRINILDIVRPVEIYIKKVGCNSKKGDAEEQNQIYEMEQIDEEKDSMNGWVVDTSFKNHLLKRDIPSDPEEWKSQHVLYWVVWAFDKFRLSDIDIMKWNLSWKRLKGMTRPEFQERVPQDPFDLFWTHFELLRKFKVVALKQVSAELEPNHPNEHPVIETAPLSNQNSSANECSAENLTNSSKKPLKQVSAERVPKHPKELPVIKTEPLSNQNSSANERSAEKRTNNSKKRLKQVSAELEPKHPKELPVIETEPLSNQNSSANECSAKKRTKNSKNPSQKTIRLRQFLLELLTDSVHQKVIQWVGKDGEFEIVNPELLAHLWGLRNKKTTMKYRNVRQSLSTLINADMLEKIPHSRFRYKFTCDVKSGFVLDAEESDTLVTGHNQEFVNDGSPEEYILPKHATPNYFYDCTS